MSKMDGLRAMREARYEQSRATQPAASRKVTRRPDPEPVVAKPPAADPGDAQASEAPLCGHRAISGRTCTREHGHAAKSHRYS
jgi:hypothetical protein